MYQTQSISFQINGAQVEVWTEGRRLLADTIRDELGLKGTHLGCEHGVCGACTVLVDGRAVRSCLMLTPQVQGKQVVTVEGARADNVLGGLQRAFQEKHGLQCGFCTPGFLMTACELLQTGCELTEHSVREHLSGNICRCTGYSNIIDAVLEAAESA